MMKATFSQVIYLLQSLFVFDCSFAAVVDTCADPEVFVVFAVAIWNYFILFITAGKFLCTQCNECFLLMHLISPFYVSI